MTSATVSERDDRDDDESASGPRVASPVSETPRNVLAGVTTSADERLRLETCARERIRVPGAIQSYGALLSVDLATFTVLQASENAIDVLGVDTDALIGARVADLAGQDVVERCLAIVQHRGLAANPVAAQIDGRRFDVIIHEADGVGIVEFEPELAGEYSAATVHAAIHRLSAAATVPEIYAQTAIELRHLTGYDRVVVYRFHPDGHGEVVAEDLEDGMEPYLGLHFPASDIPAQARQLYVSKLTRAIVLDDAPPAPLAPALNPLTGQPLDLGHAELRSVSPDHVQFMRNMGQVSTISLSLVHGDALIGMITCAHRTTRRLPYLLREGFAVLARQVSMQLGTAAEIERLTRIDAVRTVRASLARQVKSSDDLSSALIEGEFTLLDLIPADGATLHVDGASTSIGEAPAAMIGPELLAELTGAEAATVVSDAVSVDYPRLHSLMPDIAGVLVVPFGADGDYLAWFRKETVATVRWLGDQSSANRVTPLTPRTSFAAWSESVAGKSTPWDRLALLEASEIRHDLNAALLRAAESALARVALHDPLTGLPNRRLLGDRLEQAMSTLERDAPVALLFADLDSFKQINDSEGHGAGDAVIIAAAGIIRETIRSQDTVARIGGDEFVVVCEGAGRVEAEAAAQRIVEAFTAPLVVQGSQYQVGVSIGIAIAAPGQEPDDLLRAADAAMYRAKEGGRGRASY
ncbi:bifunctional diguanylate cyclase/phosphodiesterase [Demequina muriae]|uniref:Diguanylate cyclase n=1 Tax=Demequina muriae TaxID=3051664 RepID=A0ABT8GJP6_9MICO|nr:sensor domain-containing diguanylate cyclase [Demequina sp. EGI L300058]MDN4481663.1 diguanylate cyclase [Demequina sp. EGI L300058]